MNGFFKGIRLLMTRTTLGTGHGGTRGPTAVWTACSFVWLVLMAGACNAEAVISTVNPPEAVSAELTPYVDQFEQALRNNGFTIADQRDPKNLDLRLSLATSTGSITISSELLQDGQTLVATPVKNRTFSKESAIAGTARVAAQRFSSDVARYAASVGGVSAGANVAATSSGASEPTALPKASAPAALPNASPPAELSRASAPQGRPPVRRWQDVKVYFHPPDKRYEEIGLLEASSKNSWSFSAQGKMDKVVERLKVQAAKMGANGVLLVGVGNEYSGSVNTGHASATAYGNTAYGNSFGTSVAVMHKSGSAIAIYVYEAEVAAPPAVQAAPVVQAAAVAGSPPTVQRENRQRTDEIYDAILKLDDLRKRGLITDAEFNAEKQKVLASH
jgi:hypothetical protein